jgi:uncharacterized protein (TIRG00374 family)
MRTTPAPSPAGWGRSRFRLLAIALGVVLSALFTYLAIRDVDFGLFADTLSESEYWWFAPAIALHFAAVGVRVVRWSLLFAPATRPPLRPLADAILIGYFVDSIAPVRAGDAARIVVLPQAAGTSRSETAATVVSERAYDVLGLLVLLAVAAPFVPDAPWLGAVALAALVLAGVLVALLVALERFGERPLAVILSRVARLLRMAPPRGGTAGESFVRGLAGFRRPRTAVAASMLTVVSWLLVAASYWLALVGLDVGLGFGAALLVVVATSFSFAVPSLPAAVGVFEAATLVALTPFDLDASRALSCAVVLHVLAFVPFMALGAFVLQRHAWSLRDAGPDARSR